MQPEICCVILKISDAKLRLLGTNGQTSSSLFPEKGPFYRDKSRNHSFLDFPFLGGSFISTQRYGATEIKTISATLWH